MTTKPRLVLDAKACDGCGQCYGCCPKRALRVGPTYIYIDWAKCDGCEQCVSMCDRGAIRVREAGPPLSSSVVLPNPVEALIGLSGKREPGPAVVWTVQEGVALVLAVLALYLSQDAIMASPMLKGMNVAGLVTFRAMLLAVYYAAQIGLLAFLTWRHDSEFFSAMRLSFVEAPRLAWAVSAGWVALAFIAVRGATTLYGVVAQSVGWSEGSSQALTQVFGPGQEGLLLAIAMVVLVGPFVEELVFRGVALDAFSRRYGRVPALFATSALFAAFHFSLWMLLPTFMLGLALGLLAQKRPSLWPAVVLHSLYNAVAVAAAFWLAAGR